MNGTPLDLTRNTLAVLVVAGLLTSCFWILGPFLPAVVWAATLVIASWPLMLRVQAGLWHRRSLAVIVMTLVLLLLFVVPFWFAIGTIVDHAGTIAGWARDVTEFKVPPPPDWIGELPLIGQQAAQTWNDAVDMGLHDLAPQLEPYAGRVTNWFVAEVGSVGLVFAQFLLTLIIAAMMFARGEQAAVLAVRFGRRLGGDRGEQAVWLAARAIRGVALAVVVVAVLQSLLSGIAMHIAGMPLASVLTALVFMLCVAQIGPSPVLFSAIIWAFANGSTGWAVFLLIASFVIIGLEYVLRPILISKGAALPLLLIFAGVIGGLLAFGLVGIFLGPAVLAVTYTLLQAWMAEDDVASRSMGSVDTG